MECLTGNIFYYPHQPELDRPMLAYLQGSKFSLAVDVGYSGNHVREFYGALEAAKLGKPDFTAITHWHYDHSFGLHHACGTSIACRRTNAFLKGQQEKAAEPGYLDWLKGQDSFFAKEYRGQGKPEIALADMEFQGRLVLRLGGLTAELFQTESPHSEDTVCIYVPEEKTLFLGDSTSEDFFNHSYMDQAKLARLVRMIEGMDCRYCILSHAEPLRKAELLEYLYTVMEA